jgi:hypothetical protein
LWCWLCRLVAEQDGELHATAVQVGVWCGVCVSGASTWCVCGCGCGCGWGVSRVCLGRSLSCAVLCECAEQHGELSVGGWEEEEEEEDCSMRGCAGL